MTWKRLFEKLHVRSYFAKLMVGAVLIALVISLNMIGILKLLGFSVNPAIPLALIVSTF